MTPTTTQFNNQKQNSMYAVMRKTNSPPVIVCQYTWKFANMVLIGYDMLYQGEQTDCQLILHSLNNP